MITFKKFNDTYNGDRAGYVHLQYGKPISGQKLTPLTFEEISKIANSEPDMEIGWLVPKGYLIIDIDDRTTSDIVLKIIQDRKEKVMCVRTTRGMHIYTKSDYNSKTVNNITAIGAMADTIPYCNGNTFITTPFKNPKINKSKKLLGREVIYYNGIEKIPFWLTPIFQRGKKPEDNFITFPLNDARNESYNRHLWRLKITNLSPDERAECIKLINTYVASTPLTEKEMEETMLRDSNNENLPETKFFDGSTFKHDAMGDFLIDYLKIKKCKRTRNLYYYDEDLGLYVSNNDYIKGVMTKMCPQLKDFQKREALSYIDNLLELKPTIFNRDPMKVSFLNGRLDLKTMDFEPPSPEHLETIHLHVNYNPDATGVTADEFFDTATCHDKDCEQLLYEAIGYSFIKTSSLQKAFLLYGGGRNGKSTFLDIIKEICGHENCTSVNFKDLGEKFRVAELYNKLVSLSGDISAQPLKDSDLFKQITGGDEITIERKNQHPFTDTVFATLFFSANKLPRTPDTTFGFYRKLVIIPFNANLSSVSLVDGAAFHDRLMADKEYIAYKAICAIKEVLNTTHKFTEPKAATEVMNMYKIENSSILSWLKAKKLDATYLKSKKFEEIFTEYTLWCELNGFKSVRSSRFEQEIAEELNLVIDNDTLIDK